MNLKVVLAKIEKNKIMEFFKPYTYTKKERLKLTQMAETMIVVLERNKIHYEDQLFCIEKAKHLIVQRRKYKVKAEISKLKSKIKISSLDLRSSILKEMELGLKEKENEYLILSKK